MTPATLGLLATAGFTKVRVIEYVTNCSIFFRHTSLISCKRALLFCSKPRVSVLSTGNELQLPGETPIYGKIRDSNKTTLLALLEENGFSAYDSGIAPDEYVFGLTFVKKKTKKENSSKWDRFCCFRYAGQIFY